MKSSTGKYYLGLDQIRGVAALIVFTWHFVQVHNNAFKTGPTIPPFNLFTEGHTGVALFMCLSGYLFAKLLKNKTIDYEKFIFNRLLRLLPLLTLIIIINGITSIDNLTMLIDYVKYILKGIIYPSLPNGGWSITVEFHFYLIVPFLLLLSLKRRNSLIWLLMLTIVIRILLYLKLGEIQSLSYWTLVGRIDQFILGILAFKFHQVIKGKNIFILTCFVFFLLFYYYFDYMGGFFSNPSYPSNSPLWIIIPTIEGFSFSLIIAWYDNTITPSNNWFNRITANVGKYSYSIYLLHFFFVFKMSEFVNNNIIELSNIYITLIFSLLCFLIMIPIGYLSFRFIEKPFLKYRINYLKENKTTIN
ncbi:acyltransferase [uncultured Polaribacter sp.]|uniref:acyltransferase family protein n=1 Tax=uncultured Polaribacter sp. TaxID=174711 RepID=UPI00259B39A2|nr:acyltransferase [uncultured Polaribacter sp.]